MSNIQLAHSHPPSNNSTDKQAVEVVATFGDAVVGVRHLSNPKSGVVSKMTKGLLAGGIAMLATSAIAFGYAANVAAKNESDLKAWKAQGKPAWAFRPQMLPRSLDALTLGGSVLGLGALALGLMRRRDEKQPSKVRLGSAAGNDFNLQGVGESFDLVAPQGDGWAINVAPAMMGAPAGSVPVTSTTKLRLQLGATSFHIQSVPAPKATPAGLTFDRRAVGFFAASAAAHLGIIALLGTVPSGMDTANADDSNLEMVRPTAAIDGSETMPDPDVESDGKDSDYKKPASPAMALLEGTTGSDHTSPNPGTRKIRRISDARQSLSAQDAIDAAKEAGIFQADGMKSGFHDFTGDADITNGMDDADIYGNWIGDGEGSTGPGFGSGKRGFGPGGGGKDWNSIYAGDYDVIGGDPHKTGDEYSLDDDDGQPKRKHKQEHPTPKMCSGSECQILGDADPAVVRRYIKRNMSKIAFCYEKELLANPGLQGTVSTRFTVTPSGKVATSTASGVNDKVSSCVADVIENIQFPAFQVAFEVKYPFHMHPNA